MVLNQFDDDDLDEKRTGRTDFDCPDCSANNPVDDQIEHGVEVRCFYCGAGFKVEVKESGRLRFVPE